MYCCLSDEDTLNYDGVKDLLLPREGFFKLANVTTLVIAFLLCYAIAGVHSAASLHLSFVLQTAVVLWAAFCSLRRARKSHGHLRRLWILLASALFLASAAQGLETYYEIFIYPQNLALTPWPSDVLFILWVTPTLMMFLPHPAEQPKGVAWEEILDVAQVVVVALTAYLYFFYIQSKWAVEGAHMIQKIFRVQTIRDVALCVGFLIHAATMKTRPMRSFFRAMAVFFLLQSAFDAIYLLNWQPTQESRATWSDLAWCTPYFFAAVFAATWNQEVEEVPRHETRSPARLVAVWQLLPVLIPLLVLFMSRRIATEQITIAWTAVAVSFVLSAARLVYTSEKQRRISEALGQTEQALRRAEQMFFTAFRSSPDAIGISSMPRGEFLEVNDGFTRLTGYSHAETIGKTAHEMNLWEEPPQRAKVLAKMQESGVVRDEEFHCRTKSGEIRICQFSGAMIRLDGQPCALVIVRDVTARKQAEEALRASEERFRTLVREMDVGVVLQGPEGEIQFANQAAQEMFGIPLETVRGKTSAELDLIAIREDGTEIPYALRPAPRAICTGKTIKNEVIGWRRRGSEQVLWVLGNVVPIRGKDGKIAGAINTFTNITERRQAEDALRQLSTRLLQLQDEERRRLGRELHDSLAQSVLAVNLNVAQAAQSTSSLSDASKRALAEARRLLQEMSQEIRTLSYLLHPPLLDELGLVSAIKEYVEGFSDRSGLELELNLPSSFVRMAQETETALFRIVQESLSNIQRHSGSTTASICLSGDGDWVKLEVRDHGKGMGPRAGPADREASDPARLGVGILGMRERMSQLGGKLEIESTPSGTTVRATVPFVVEASDVSPDSDR